MTDLSQPTQPNRIFRIGGATVHEDESMRNLSISEIQELLQHSHPEVKHADHETKQTEDGIHVVTFKPKPGRKG